MAYEWEELYQNLRFLYVAYKNVGDGITTQEMASLDKNLTYQSTYARFKRMETNGLFTVERYPRSERGGHSGLRFNISKKGITKVVSLKERGIFKDEYDEEHWKLW